MPMSAPTTRSQKKALSRAREPPSDSGTSATNSPVKKVPKVVKGGRSRGGKTKVPEAPLSPRKEPAKRSATTPQTDVDASQDSSTMTMSDVDKALDSSMELRRAEVAHKAAIAAAVADAIKTTKKANKEAMKKLKTDITNLNDAHKDEVTRLKDELKTISAQLKEANKQLKKKAKVEDEYGIVVPLETSTPSGRVHRKSRTAVSPAIGLDPVETFKHTVDTTTSLLAYSIQKTKDFDNWRASINDPPSAAVAPVDMAAEFDAMRDELQVRVSLTFFFSFPLILVNYIAGKVSEDYR